MTGKRADGYNASNFALCRLARGISSGFVAAAILAETGENLVGRDLLDQIARLIEIFGVLGAAEIVGCPGRPCYPDANPRTNP